jgi:hypothetical protein
MKIENIKDLAPTFAGNYTDEDVQENIYEEYYNKRENYKEYIGFKYFFGHLHDSNILSCKKIMVIYI